jgi:hypothetical protein
MASAFDGAGQGALVFGTGARLPARADFAIVGNIAPENIHLFVVDYGIFVRTELAFTRAGIEAPWPAARVRV